MPNLSAYTKWFLIIFSPHNFIWIICFRQVLWDVLHVYLKILSLFDGSELLRQCIKNQAIYAPNLFFILLITQSHAFYFGFRNSILWIQFLFYYLLLLNLCWTLWPCLTLYNEITQLLVFKSVLYTLQRFKLSWLHMLINPDSPAPGWPCRMQTHIQPPSSWAFIKHF